MEKITIPNPISSGYCKMWNKQTQYPLVIIKNAGHNANVDNPMETNLILAAFIQQVLGECANDI